MADPIVIVTGVPAAGKSTISAALAKWWDAELISLDVIKEALYDADPSIGNSSELRFAAEAELWRRIAVAQGPVVIDVWVAPDRDEARIVAALEPYRPRVVEVLCRVSADVAVARYVGRVRIGPHQPADEPTLQRIRAAVAAIGPLGIGPCLDLDTEHPVDIAEVAATVARWT